MINIRGYCLARVLAPYSIFGFGRNERSATGFIFHWICSRECTFRNVKCELQPRALKDETRAASVSCIAVLWCPLSRHFLSISNPCDHPQWFLTSLSLWWIVAHFRWLSFRSGQVARKKSHTINIITMPHANTTHVPLPKKEERKTYRASERRAHGRMGKLLIASVCLRARALAKNMHMNSFVCSAFFCVCNEANGSAYYMERVRHVLWRCENPLYLRFALIQNGSSFLSTKCWQNDGVRGITSTFCYNFWSSEYLCRHFNTIRKVKPLGILLNYF